jgi:alkylhydroperoxidase family enzyme
LTDEEVTAIREGQFENFALPDLALLRMADAMSDTPSNISEELYAELRRFFSEEQLMELAANAALENYRARFNRVFDVGSDGLYRKGVKFKQQKIA